MDVDPAVCEPVDAIAWLGLGSARLAVMGHDPSGDCVVEWLTEVEAGFRHHVCRLSQDAGTFRFDPRELAPPDPPFPERCEVVAEGHLILEDMGDPLVFPHTAEP